ncbi:hypothetical protein VP1G_00796 [Cytospora mali]|uniref:Uncharacterized protein n=1 Tax=Cytospora mali TaxID=578113 RepID=A0A194UNP2_CYTMA|nr:hypothetical protein VP1G_00796 [Valsa mali var. pyri (nom. inval.)]
MGQSSSHTTITTTTVPNNNTNLPETRVEDPGPQDAATGTAATSPRGLALIAHGRFANKDQRLVRGLAGYFRDERRLRVVTWDDWEAGGRGVWEDLEVWNGEVGARDYNRILHEAMAKFAADFPDVQDPELFICGYSAGAISAGCARPPPSPTITTHFSPTRYILISYPVETNFFITLLRAGPCFRAVEALVQGFGWENLPGEHGGREPDVAGVLTITGADDRGRFYGVWTRILGRKNARGNLRQVVVEGVGHLWVDGMVDRAVEEVRKWLV